MATERKDTPDFFEDNLFDPVETATGYPPKSPRVKTAGTLEGPRKGMPPKAGSSAEKKKAGFYLAVDVLNRFTLKFHELKLAGIAIENKSALLELLLTFGLNDMDKGDDSHLLRKLKD